MGSNIIMFLVLKWSGNQNHECSIVLIVSKQDSAIPSVYASVRVEFFTMLILPLGYVEGWIFGFQFFFC